MTDCYGCGAESGTEHRDGCDVARCMWTGGQRLQCGLGIVADAVRALRRYAENRLADDLAAYESLNDEAHDCGRDVWTGEWPGTAECREFGWYAWFGPDLGRTGWVEIDADEVEHFRLLHPEVQVSEDLNRLAVEAVWDASAGHWVKTTGGERS